MQNIVLGNETNEETSVNKTPLMETDLTFKEFDELVVTRTDHLLPEAKSTFVRRLL